MGKRIYWIDLLRGICMIAILLDHTEIYYTDINIINYNAYVVNALTIFFIISGYLFYREEGLDIKKKLKSLVRKLLIPYFIFSAIIAVPKAVVRSYDIDIPHIVSQILLGQSSWFVAALFLSELIFISIIKATRGKNIPIFIIAIFALCASIWLSKGNRPYPWQLDNSMQSIFFLTIGYFFHKYEQVINTYCKISNIILLFIVLIFIKIYVLTNNVNMMIWYIDISNYPIFLADTTICALAMMQLCKNLPSIKWLEWTGANSIVYYFLCGGIPLLTAMALNRVGLSYNGNYALVVLAICIVYIVSTIIAWIIYKYLPFIVGK